MNPKRHHFLPECYLNEFAREKLIWVYDRQKKEYRRQPIRNTAVISHYYTRTGENGERDYSLETFLSKVEGKAKVVIEKLDGMELITPQERLDLATFIALLVSRTPKYERETTYIADAFHKILAKEMIPTVEAAGKLLKQSGTTGVTAESMFKFIHEEQFNMVASRDTTNGLMLDGVSKITKEVAFFDWALYHTPKGSSFVTCDSPLAYIVPDEMRASQAPVLGIASEIVTKIVPLTRGTALFLGKAGGRLGHFRMNRQQVRDTNTLIARECDRFVLGQDEALVRSIVARSGINEHQTSSRMVVENIPHPTIPNRSIVVTKHVAAPHPLTP